MLNRKNRIEKYENILHEGVIQDPAASVPPHTFSQLVHGLCHEEVT